MNAERGINKIEQKRFKPTFEIGNLEDTESMANFYAVSKIVENRWGNEQNENIAADIKNKKIQLDQELIDSYKKIRELSNNNDETLSWLAFAVERDEETQSCIRDLMVKHKDFNEADAKKLNFEFKDFYQKIKQKINLKELIEAFITTDIDQRKENLPKLRIKVDEAIKFFNPQNLKIEKIVYLPTNPLEKKQSGGGVEIGKSFYINAENGNEVNEIHEFLHSIINPILEKLKLNEGEEKKILNICSTEELENYEYPISILTEKIIKIYHTGFNIENKPTEDKLSERIWEFFEEYINSGISNFEEFFLDNYGMILQE